MPTEQGGIFGIAHQWYTLKRLLKKPIITHIFRQLYACYLKNVGFSTEWIQNFWGHASYKTTMIMYGTLFIDEMPQEAEGKLKE